MLYQKLLMGKTSYFVSVNDTINFQTHRHPELELSYCIDGSYHIVIDNKEYSLKSGDLAYIKPMAAHEIKSSGKGTMMTLELGPGFLGEYFNSFLNTDFDTLLTKDRTDEPTVQLLHLIEGLSCAQSERNEFSSLTIKGTLFLISSLLLQHFTKNQLQHTPSKDLLDIQKVEKSIQIIYDEYPQKLNIDYICNQCGYSKSHFCRVFKKITGETFHHVLNRHRIEIACMHLRESTDSIEDIATYVGFSDSKTFCRTFKTYMNISPGAYRKKSLTNQK